MTPNSLTHRGGGVRGAQPTHFGAVKKEGVKRVSRNQRLFLLSEQFQGDLSISGGVSDSCARRGLVEE